METPLRVSLMLLWGLSAAPSFALAGPLMGSAYPAVRVASFAPGSGILVSGGGASVYSPVTFLSCPAVPWSGTFPIPRCSDSLLPVLNNISRTDSMAVDIEDIETDYRKTRNDRKALVHMLKIIRFGRPARNTRVKARLFEDLADLSVRLKLYPLAMRCYYKSVQLRKKSRQPAFTLDDSAIAQASLPGDYLPLDSAVYARLADIDTAQIDPGIHYAGRSEPVSGKEIWEPFKDGKTASSYALLLHVKQPVPGKRKSFTGINNVGHTFITLIKYNADNSFVCRSFGFYPHKKGPLTGTPFHPGAASFFRDDTKHDWDEIVGKFITFRQFRRIIEVVKRYDGRMYDLNQNNCTDFGLNVAMIGGITLTDTQGTWPFGKGNNPANAGQSILEGKMNNLDVDITDPLFVKSNILTGNK